MQSAVIQRAVAQAELRANRWHTLIAGITNFAPADRKLTAKALSEALPKLSDADRKSVWEDLLKEVEKHERFADAKWALPKDQLAPLRALVDQYAPNDPAGTRPGSCSTAGPSTQSGDREPVNSVRQVRLSEFLKSHGPAAVADLAARVQNSYEVVEVLGRINVSRDQLETIASLSLTDEPNGFTIGLLATIANRFGVEAAQQWLLKIRGEKHPTDAAVARLCQGFTDNRETWAFVKSLGAGVEASYWTTKGPFWLKGDKDELLEAIDTYLTYGRADSGIGSELAATGRPADADNSQYSRIHRARTKHGFKSRFHHGQLRNVAEGVLEELNKRDGYRHRRYCAP